MVPHPLCFTDTICGNNFVDDTCYGQPMPGHCYFQPAMGEQCDGTMVKGCAALGYSDGGTTTCTADCRRIITDGCRACAGEVCVTRPSITTRDLVVSGSRFALVGFSALAIFDGPTFVTEVAIQNVQTAVGVPQGFLVAADSPARVITVDAAGVVGTPRAVPFLSRAVMAYGAGGRVIVAWTEPTATQREVHATILDVDGTTLVANKVLFAGGPELAATSDATSFFVGASGTLARVLPDGTTTLTTGFAPSTGTSRVGLSFDGTRGWYVVRDDAANSIERFDAMGTRIGNRVPVTGAIHDFVGNGEELLMLAGFADLELRRLTPQDTVATGATFGRRVLGNGLQLGRVGSQLVAAWNTDATLQLSFVAVP